VSRCTYALFDLAQVSLDGKFILIILMFFLYFVLLILVVLLSYVARNLWEFLYWTVKKTSRLGLYAERLDFSQATMMYTLLHQQMADSVVKCAWHCRGALVIKCLFKSWYVNPLTAAHRVYDSFLYFDSQLKTKSPTGYYYFADYTNAALHVCHIDYDKGFCDNIVARVKFWFRPCSV
jgi:hypothetical protein